MKIKDLSWLQVVLLFIGVIFTSWVLYSEPMSNFWLNLYFYSFLIFLVTWLMGIYVLRAGNKSLQLILQKRLVATLSIGAFLTTVNFGLSACNFYNKRFCAPTCRVGIDNPLVSPCFYGAIIFLISLWVAIKLYKKFKKVQ
ncbi:hypothetical protein KKE14_02490 [Patescibacteria group bacterium]|nr:hypothetical protein [Patescibacteria group bacterium]